MAQRRMLSRRITASDRFLELPIMAKLLYIHLCLDGDDDGFVGSPRGIARSIGCEESELKRLERESYIHIFKSGVVVILDWLIHNTLRNDRYKETIYLEEKKMLRIGENGRYYLVEPSDAAEDQSGNQLATKWQPNIT